MNTDVQGLKFYREMLKIRRFEERSAELYGEMKIRGFLHLSVGQEAIAGQRLSRTWPCDCSGSSA